METIAVERSIWIAAPRERVWRAITDPWEVERWFSPGTSWRTTGQGVGSRLSVYDAATDTDLYTQVVDVFDPPSRLVTRSEDTPYMTTWKLEDENGGTRLTLIHSGYELEPEATRRQNMDQNAAGFGMMLENVKAVAEGQPLPYPQGF